MGSGSVYTGIDESTAHNHRRMRNRDHCYILRHGLIFFANEYLIHTHAATIDSLRPLRVVGGVLVALNRKDPATVAGSLLCWSGLQHRVAPVF
jgi:hypothetical protein